MLEEAIFFLILYAVFVFTDIVPLYKQKNKKGIIICTSILVLAFVCEFLTVFGVKLPRYADILGNIVKFVTGYSGEK